MDRLIVTVAGTPCGIYRFSPRVSEVAIKIYARFDISHDLSHAKRVVWNAYLLWSMLKLPQVDLPIIMISALLHDVIDRKYPESALTPAQLQESIAEDVTGEQLEEIMWIVQNMSWSGETAGRNKPLPDRNGQPRDHLRRLVQDADWIDAIDWERCYAFGVAKNPGIDGPTATRLTREHAEVKLLKIIDHLHSEEAKLIAAPLHGKLMMTYQASL